MTPLARKSDVVYLVLTRVFHGAQNAFKNIKHVSEYHIEGEVGLDVLRMIVGRENSDREEDDGPGTVLYPNDAKFFEALSSPNPRFLGWRYGHSARFNCPSYVDDEHPMDIDNVGDYDDNVSDDDADHMSDKIKRSMRRRDTQVNWCLYVKIRQLPA
ncbi:hypothetical protein AC579_4730 [Pseudocercospora musae]|uniref:Uncharacterized protein n=1 Tax=Pseudocercospora musae TaxID=113226 RepID=A0A139IQC0_9PEZI|nr:hypothetical protein AC579_4730 [Pseudocercospora musae]